MKILIIEDEPIIARRIKRMVNAAFEDNQVSIALSNSVEGGLDYLSQNEIDLLFLDLNLHGEDGFSVLESMVAAPFHTIIISAYKEKALQAFEYGVLDFVPKPFNQERINQALQRLQSVQTTPRSTRYLAIQKKGRHLLREIQELSHIKGAGVYSELFFMDGTKEIHNKNLDKLDQLLPPNFDRIHKSYIINSSLIQELIVQSGSRYSVVLQDETTLPVSRMLYKSFKEKWAI